MFFAAKIFSGGQKIDNVSWRWLFVDSVLEKMRGNQNSQMPVEKLAFRRSVHPLSLMTLDEIWVDAEDKDLLVER